MKIAEYLQVAGVILVLFGTVMCFIGSAVSDRSILEIIQTSVKEAKIRKEPQWTPFQKIKIVGVPDLGIPFPVKLQISLESKDNTIPLMAKIASDSEGSYPNTISGPAGVVEQLVIDR